MERHAREEIRQGKLSEIFEASRRIPAKNGIGYVQKDPSIKSVNKQNSDMIDPPFRAE